MGDQSQSINLSRHNAVNLDRICPFYISLSCADCKTCEEHKPTTKPSGKLTIDCECSSVQCQSCAEDDSYCKHQNQRSKGSGRLRPFFNIQMWTPNNDRVD